MAGSFWSNFGTRFTSSVSSGLDELLERGEGNFTLQEVLGHEQVIQECKYLNQQLIEYLSKPQVVKQLVEYIITVPPDAASGESGGSSDNRGGITTAASLKRAKEAAAAAAASAAGSSTATATPAASGSGSSDEKSDVESGAHSNSSSDDEDDDDENKKDLEQKYPYQASELFLCEVPSMLDAIFEPEDETIAAAATPASTTTAPLANVIEEEDADANSPKPNSPPTTAASPSPAGGAPLSPVVGSLRSPVSPAPVPTPRLPILDLLLSFLDQPAPINPAHASYFRKVMVILIQRKYEPLVKYMSLHGTLDKLLNHIGLYSIMELCPLSDTPVVLGDGSVVPVGSVKAGQTLWSINGEATKVIVNKVERVESMIRINDEEGRQVTVTNNHTLNMVWAKEPNVRTTHPMTETSYWRTVEVDYYDHALLSHTSTIATFLLPGDATPALSSQSHLPVPFLGVVPSLDVALSSVSSWLSSTPSGASALRAGSEVEIRAQTLTDNWDRPQFETIKQAIRTALAPLPPNMQTKAGAAARDAELLSLVESQLADHTHFTQSVRFGGSSRIQSFLAPTRPTKLIYILPDSHQSASLTAMHLHQLTRAWALLDFDSSVDDILITTSNDLKHALDLEPTAILALGGEAANRCPNEIACIDGVTECTLADDKSITLHYHGRPVTLFPTPVHPCQLSHFSSVLDALTHAHLFVSPTRPIVRPTRESIVTSLTSRLLKPESLTGSFEIAKVMVDHPSHTYILANNIVCHNCIMIGWDDGLGNNQDVAWLVQADLTGKLIEKLNPIWDSEYHQPDVIINSSRALVDVVVKCPASAHNPLITRLLATPCQELLFKHMFSGSPLALSNALSIVIVLVQRYANRMDLGEEIMDEVKAAALAAQAAALDAPEDAQSPFDESLIAASPSPAANTLPEPFHSLVPHLTRILSLLTSEEPPEEQWSYGRGRAFGETRLKVVEMILVLVRCQVVEVEEIFRDTNLLTQLLDAFTAYPWNNMLHGLVESIIRTILEFLQETCLKPALFIQAKLIERVIDAYERNAKVCEQGKGFRLGYMGHLLRTADVIEQYLLSATTQDGVTRASILGSSETADRWSAFVSGPLAAESDACKIVLPPMDACDDDDFVSDRFEPDTLFAALKLQQQQQAEADKHDEMQAEFDPDDATNAGYDYSAQMDGGMSGGDWADFNTHFSDARIGESPGATSPDANRMSSWPSLGGVNARQLLEFASHPDEDGDSEEEADADADDGDWADFGTTPAAPATSPPGSPKQANAHTNNDTQTTNTNTNDDFADFEADFNQAN